MCYSGKCTWESHTGDCAFPNFKEVRDKYKFPLCEIDVDNEEDMEKLQRMISDAKAIELKCREDKRL